MLPEQFRPSPAFFLMMAGIVVAGNAAKGELHVKGAWDVVAFVLFCLMMLWLLSERRGSADHEGHEGAGNSVPFRLGQSLKRVRRSFRRSA